jgi:chemotaxis methyl-accepting protein methylase/mannose-6-phosphate isomerase-like protein (cupin superfamily)
MRYTHSLPSSVAFAGKGLHGYTFGPLNQKDLEIYYIEVKEGHDFFMISKKIARTYYLISGNGYFTIANTKYDVRAGMLVEVPPGVEYCYSGKMTMLGVSKPRWSVGNDKATRWNSDVAGEDSSMIKDQNDSLKRMLNMTVLGKSPFGIFHRLSESFWKSLPSPLRASRPVCSYGKFIHMLVQRRGLRAQVHGTYFLRNRPQLELIRRVIDKRPKGDKLQVAVLGCSTGPEAYSVAWSIRSARPDVALALAAADIAEEAIETAKLGVYPLSRSKLGGTAVCERFTQLEMDEFFQRNGDEVTVKPWLKEGIDWRVEDVRDRNIVDSFGYQDLVVANNFLCHMNPAQAEDCLRNLVRIIKPGGYLFVSGVELDVRTKVAQDLGWEPVEELLEEIHEGDILRNDWPFNYYGLEPLDKAKRDWKVRYASAFRIPAKTEARPSVPAYSAVSFLSL